MSEGLHVVFAIDSATYGGAEECVAQLLHGLPADVRRTAVATRPVPVRFAERARAAGVPVIATAPVRGHPDGAARVAAVLAALRPGVVHVNLTDPATCVEMLVGALGSGARVVADVHMTGTLGAGAARRRLAEAYRSTAAVLARSRRVAGLAVRGLGVPADRVRVVRNGVPVPVPVPLPVERARGGGGPVRIRAVGRLTAQKGFDLLVEAIRTLVRDGAPVEVDIAGEGREHAALVARAAGLPVRFVGFVPDVPGFLAGADVFCLPSRGEALPLALLEAAVAGLPCVATDVGDVAAAVGDIAWVVPPEDLDALTAALRALVADGSLRSRLADAARREAPRRFDQRATVAAVHDAYRAVLGQ